MRYDIAIIGGGPAVILLPREQELTVCVLFCLRKKQWAVCVLMKDVFLPKPCFIPLRCWTVLRVRRNTVLSVEGAPAFDMEKIIGRKNKTVQKLTGGVRMTVNSYGVTIVVRSGDGEGEEGFHIRCDGEVYEATYLLVCTGSDTVIPPIKGLSDVDYWTSREALDSTVLPSSLAIIGGGVIRNGVCFIL